MLYITVDHTKSMIPLFQSIPYYVLISVEYWKYLN